MISPPRDESELKSRLRALSGRTLGELAAIAGDAVPERLLHAKGWAGMLLERLLGATAASRAEPDFPGLGIELKTLPVDPFGRPRESTFVATLDVTDPASFLWETSSVRKKLARVAWVPVVGTKETPIASRVIGAALVWSPSADEEAALRADYQEIVELVEEGLGERISAHRGEWLQLRPKGADASSLRWTRDEEGNPVRTAPRAFYLRTRFTEALLRRHFLMPPAPARAATGRRT